MGLHLSQQSQKLDTYIYTLSTNKPLKSKKTNISFTDSFYQQMILLIKSIKFSENPIVYMYNLYLSIYVSANDTDLVITDDSCFHLLFVNTPIK
jgi:hypothetical protein